jgi:hypothetical protein
MPENHQRHLELQRLTRLLRHRSLDIRRPQKRIRIREAGGTKRTRLRSIRALAPKNRVNNNSISALHSSAHPPSKVSAPHLPNFIAALAIDHFLAAILEHGALHERLRTHARVHARRLLVVVVVEDVCGAEAQKRAAAGDFVEVVVGVGDAEVAGVFGGVAVRVADEGAFGLGRGG